MTSGMKLMMKCSIYLMFSFQTPFWNVFIWGARDISRSPEPPRVSSSNVLEEESTSKQLPSFFFFFERQDLLQRRFADKVLTYESVLHRIGKLKVASWLGSSRRCGFSRWWFKWSTKNAGIAAVAVESVWPLNCRKRCENIYIQKPFVMLLS